MRFASHLAAVCRRLVLLLTIATAPLLTQAQLAGDDPDWQEEAVPPPPTFSLSRLIPFEVSASSDLKYGVDPESISIGRDGVVRYVIVARSSSGAVNAFHEGIRCARSELRVYARRALDGAWTRSTSSEWRSLRDPAIPRHSLRFAQQGGCRGNAPQVSVADIVRNLRGQNHEMTN